MAKSIISKIVYFDKETIRNILQERDHGELSRITDVSSAIQSQISATAEASTSLRVAGGYLKIVKGGIDGVDAKEFKTVMDSYDGYDTYKVDAKCYVRFNNSAFVSNYKRNDLLTTTMTLYCIPVGTFDKERFDFIQEISKMEHLVSTAKKPQTLADLYPAEMGMAKADTRKVDSCSENVTLYDVLYACVTAEVSDEK